MSAIKELLHRHQLGISSPGEALDEIAEAMGGEVAGRTKILAPSPGCDADDRSMVVFFSNPARPEQFYIYSCEGSLRQAEATVREKLALVEPGEEPDTAERTAAALRIWEQSVPAAGTPVETYLRSRAITLPIPATVRYHGRLRHGPGGGDWPAMVALVTDATNKPVAIHRTYLTPGGKRKAPVDPDKMSLGPLRGNAVRLAPLADDLMVGEGIETCLSAMMTGRPAWAAVSAMGLRALVLPQEVRSVTILVDGDDAGRRAARQAQVRWEREGRDVLLCHAPEGKDFNDLLMEE